LPYTHRRVSGTAMIPSPASCFLHLKYYRYLEHVGVNEDFDAGYRSYEEFQEWLRKDPIKLQREKLIKQEMVEDAIVKIEKEIDGRIEGSLQRAKSAPFADSDEIYEDVLA
jgi:TPP-dependent pyruvate/acetoin dehydrogenase alpha subunit